MIYRVEQSPPPLEGASQGETIVREVVALGALAGQEIGGLMLPGMGDNEDDKPFDQESFDEVMGALNSEQEDLKVGIKAWHDQIIGKQDVTLYQQYVVTTESDTIMDQRDVVIV